MIPKIIHYCWFGRKDKDSRILKYINTWRNNLPDYQIIEWNEDNFPICAYKYTQQAYEEKKYAFVSDVARLYALYKYGGIYFDTDIEVLRSLDTILKYNLVASWESNSLLMTAFMAASKENSVIYDFLSLYNNILYIDENGQVDNTANTIRFTMLLEGKGLRINRQAQILEDGICIRCTEEIGAFDADTMTICKTNNTLLVHHCNASWFEPRERLKHFMKMHIAKIVGQNGYERIKCIIRRMKQGNDI